MTISGFQSRLDTAHYLPWAAHRVMVNGTSDLTCTGPRLWTNAGSIKAVIYELEIWWITIPACLVRPILPEILPSIPSDYLRT